MADRPSGEPPADATAGREAQKHDLAYSDSGGEPEPGLYPADGIPECKGDITPDAAHPTVEWDDRVQPERPDEREAEHDIEKEGT